MRGGKNLWRPSWLLLLSIVLCAISCVDGLANAQTWNGFEPADLTVYSVDTHQVVGHSHYEISMVDGGAEIRGEVHYLDGESDVERDRIEFSSAGEIPRLAKFSHIFFLGNGELRMSTEADLKSGAASCSRYEGDPATVTEKLDFPPDTYAGVTTLIPIEHGLRHGMRTGIRFHVFSCAPKPRIFQLDASEDLTQGQWASYTGKLSRIRVRPEFGWLTVIAVPFLPKFYEWFDSGQNWQYLGGTTERYYKGPAVDLVREPRPEFHQAPETSAAAPQWSERPQ